MNIKNLINQGSMYLKNNDIPTYKIDSEILMMKVIDKDKKYMILNPNEILNEKKKIFYRELIKSRSFGKPIAYLVGKKNFIEN